MIQRNTADPTTVAVYQIGQILVKYAKIELETVVEVIEIDGPRDMAGTIICRRSDVHDHES